MNRRAFTVSLLIATAVAFLGGCGYPAPINPPTYHHETITQSREAARLHALDVTRAGGSGQVVLIVGSTHSMGDLMKPGDILVVDTKAPFDQRKEGEVITYLPSGADWRGARLEGDTVAHRIVGKDTYGLILSGDGNSRSEARSRVTAATYRGLVVAIYRTGTKG